MERAVEPREFRDLPLEQRSGLAFVMGHFQYGLHRSIPGPSHYVTMLRNPVDRVASLYFHYKLLATKVPGSKGFEQRDRIHRARLSLADWVFENEQLQADNGMVRQIAGRPRVRFGTCPDDMLTEALEHIEEHYAAVLIRGSMAQSVEILERIIGRALPPVERRNVNTGRDPLSAIDPAVRRRILELNHLDNQLFRLMVERFPATYERLTR